MRGSNNDVRSNRISRIIHPASRYIRSSSHITYPSPPWRCLRSTWPSRRSSSSSSSRARRRLARRGNVHTHFRFFRFRLFFPPASRPPFDRYFYRSIRLMRENTDQRGPIDRGFVASNRSIDRSRFFFRPFVRQVDGWLIERGGGTLTVRDPSFLFFLKGGRFPLFTRETSLIDPATRRSGGFIDRVIVLDRWFCRSRKI